MPEPVFPSDGMDLFYFEAAAIENGVEVTQAVGDGCEIGGAAVPPVSDAHKWITAVSDIDDHAYGAGR